MADNKRQNNPSSNEAGRERGERAGESERSAAATMRESGDAVAAATGRAGMGTAEEMRRTGEAAGEIARRGADDFAADSRRFAGSAAHEAEETAERYAEAMRHMAHDVTRLMMMPRNAGGGLQDMQEAMGGLLNGMLRTQLRVTQEMFRRANPGSVVEIQGAMLREYLDAMMEGGTTVLRAARRTADEALRPLEERQEQRNGAQRHAPSVAEVMSRQVRIIGPDETIQQAARIMAETDAGALPVGENDRLVGMVTDRDLTVRALADGKDATRTKVREVMTAETPAYVFADQDLDSAAEAMRRQQVRRMLVLDRGKRLVGILSIGDMARHASERAGRTLGGIARPGGRHRQGGEMRGR